LQVVPSSSPSDPEGLQFVLQYLSEAYGDLPIYVQENGKSNMISLFLNVLVQLYLDKITEMFMQSSQLLVH
jgi:beta-glucosidase/6-phospho-beta-glucosidase/beta-galactosidase